METLLKYEPDRQWIEHDNAKYDEQQSRRGSRSSGGSGGSGGLGIVGWAIIILVVLYFLGAS